MTDIESIIKTIEKHFESYPKPSVRAGLLINTEKMTTEEAKRFGERMHQNGYELLTLPKLEYGDEKALRIKGAHTHEIMIIARKGAYNIK